MYSEEYNVHIALAYIIANNFLFIKNLTCAQTITCIAFKLIRAMACHFLQTHMLKFVLITLIGGFYIYLK